MRYCLAIVFSMIKAHICWIGTLMKNITLYKYTATVLMSIINYPINATEQDIISANFNGRVKYVTSDGNKKQLLSELLQTK